MYLAELHGKLSSRIEGMKDVLTSNVFSFLKYSTRKLFLKGYLGRLGFAVSDRQADDAEFLFWPRLEEETEPDLVIIVGNYYILVEAKYFSGFAEGTKKTKAQLLREIDVLSTLMNSLMNASVEHIKRSKKEEEKNYLRKK